MRPPLSCPHPVTPGLPPSAGVVSEVFLPGPEAPWVAPLGPSPRPVAIRVEGEGEATGRGRRRRRPGSGRGRPGPGRPARAASRRCGACRALRAGPGRRRGRAGSPAPRPRRWPGCCGRGWAWAGRSAVWTGVGSDRTLLRRSLTSPGRSTPGGAGARCRWWCRRRGRAARASSAGSVKRRRSIDSMIVSKSPPGELGVARPAGEEGVAAEQHGRALEPEAHRARRVARA